MSIILFHVPFYEFYGAVMGRKSILRAGCVACPLTGDLRTVTREADKRRAQPGRERERGSELSPSATSEKEKTSRNRRTQERELLNKGE